MHAHEGSLKMTHYQHKNKIECTKKKKDEIRDFSSDDEPNLYNI